MSVEFIPRDVTEAIHLEQLRRHGGSPGLRDENALESALSRPLNKASYGEPDIVARAAAYAFGLARNHPFADGNKRTAIVVAVTFLIVNGYELNADDGMLYTFTMSLAAGEVDEDGAVAFFRDHTEAVPQE